MFREANEFPITVQGHIASAICVLHNFIWIHDPEDLEEAEEKNRGPFGTQVNNEEFQGIPAAERVVADIQQDKIAQEMWLQYQGYLAARSCR